MIDHAYFFVPLVYIPASLHCPLVAPTALRLVLLVGLPGSGKSSFAAALVRRCPQRRLIATDAIRSHLFGDEATQGHWLKVWQEVDRQFQQTVQQIASGQVQEAIYDATNVVRRDRRRAIAIARACGFTTVMSVWLNTPLPICLERNRQRERQVPEAVIFRMQRCLISAPPALDDGCDRLLEIG
ncbi:MAG: AAA family ATPase [Leptolyngbya sp. BL-A-14]